MKPLEKIRVPVVLILAISYTLALFAPLYPVQVRLTEHIGCDSTCFGFWISETERLELQPAILIIASGFSWKTATSPTEWGTNYSYSAHPAIALAFLLLPLLPTLALMMKAKPKDPDAQKPGVRSHLVLSRRLWRSALWGTGLCLLLLSALWAWDYLIFYGGMNRTALVDPLLTSTLGTFLLMGFGFAAMMLSIRSRALWPVRDERIE
jgi:hypothetical protein